MKLNDWIVASLNNPTFDVPDFLNILDMNLDNTLFLSKSEYLKHDSIRNAFKDDNGEFKEDLFTDFYNKAALKFADFSTEDTIDNYEYSMWDVTRPIKSRVKSPNFSLEVEQNPAHISIGKSGFNEVSASTKSKRELALNSKVYDPSTGTFSDKTLNEISLFESPIDYFKSLFDEPLVYATYDEDTEEIDPYTGNKVLHKKGEWKVNDEGEYYTEKLNGRSLIGKNVVSNLDYLTSEDVNINKYDFFDSDDLEKSVAGTVAKNVATIVPLLIPYVNTAYAGLLVGREISKSLPMMYGMVQGLTESLDINSKLLNTLAAYGLSFSGSTSDYAQENTFSFENFANLMSDVALQWGQLKFIANTFSKLTSGGKKAIDTAYVKAAKKYEDEAKKRWSEVFDGFADLLKAKAYTGLDSPFLVPKIVQEGSWVNTPLGRASIDKFLPAAKEIAENRMKIGQDLSLAYMAIISNTDVYESVLEHGGTPFEAAAIALGSTIGMFSVDKYLGLGEMFFNEEPVRKGIRDAAKNSVNLLLKTTGIKADNAITKKGFLGLVLKGINSGKKAVENYHGAIKDRTLGFVGRSLGEGLEEVSEELVTDFSKTLGEIAGRFGAFSLTDYGAWDNAFDRYAMSFLGGAAGGGLFYGIDAFLNRNNETQKSLSELTYLLRLGKKNEIIKEIDKLKKLGKLGSKNLSMNTTENNGLTTYLTANKEEDSLSLYIYDTLIKTINLLDFILNSNNLNLSESELFDKMVQGEYRADALSDFLKGDNVENVKDLSYISRFLEDFLNLTNLIVNKDIEILKLTSNVADESKKNSPEYLENLLKLQEEKLELIKQKEYLFGEGSLGYLEKTLFAIDTNLSGKFLSLNINLFARDLTGKSILQLTPAELESVLKEYDGYKKNIKYDLDTAFKLYKLMQKQVNPELKTLQEIDFEKEFKALEELRKNDPANKLLDVTAKLDSETDEEYNSLINPPEGETEELINERYKKHEEAVRKYNLDNQFKWILEFALNPITSTDFRYFVLKVGALRGELLKFYMDNITGEDGKHWYEMLPNENINPDDILEIEKLNKDLYDLILKIGILNPDELKKAIKERINTTAKTVKDRLYSDIGGIADDNDFIDTLLRISSMSTSEKEDLGIPINYEFNSEDRIITPIDAYVLTKYETNNEEEKLIDWWDIIPLKDLKSFKLFYTDAIINPDILNLEESNSVLNISENKYLEEVKLLSDDFSNIYFKSLDTFIEGVNNSPLVKTLNTLEGSGFINNPIIPLLNKISKFSSNTEVNVEELLQDVYNTYNSQETSGDFLLSEPLLTSLKQILEDFQIAKAFIYGASSIDNYNTPVGHNKAINLFTKNHSDIFGKIEELPEINENEANTLLLEIATYEKEINSWIEKHEQNSGLRELKFIKANEALVKTDLKFFKLNREAFKISPTLDLLDGYENLTLDNSLSSTITLQLLLYNNVKKSNLSISDILDKLNSKIFNTNLVIGLESAKLDENLTYDLLTDYNKFQTIVNIISGSSLKYYKNLKEFLDLTDNLAPISIQEYVSRLTFSLINNPELINKALLWLKLKTGSKMGIALNATILTGLGGSGKTFATARLNFGTGKDTWLSGPTNNQVDNLKKSLPDGIGKTKLELFNNIFGGKSPKNDDWYIKLKENGSTIVTLKDNLNIQKIDNAPKYMVIDEATHFSTHELLTISKFCNLNNILLLLIGDDHQNGYFKNNIGNIEENSLIAWRTPSLYLSLRNSNKLKVDNQLPLIQIIDKLSTGNLKSIGDSVYNLLFKNLLFKYYNKEVFSGELITDTIPNDILLKIPKDATIGFIGDESSIEYKKLKDAGLNVSDPLSIMDVLGREFNYVVVDTQWSLDLNDKWVNNNINIVDFARNLYTLITRSTEGTILIDNGLSKFVRNIESNLNGKYSGLSLSVLKFREKRIPEIEKALADNIEVSLNLEQPLELELGPEEKSEEQSIIIGDQKIEESDLKEEEQSIIIGDQKIEESDLKEEEQETKSIGDNTNEEKDSKKDELNQYTIPSHPITVYGNLSYSGIDTSEDVWENKNNSTSDLGIFIKPNLKVSSGKVELMKKVILIKDMFIYGIDQYNRLPPETKRIFSEDSFKEALFFVKIEDISNENRLIGLTEGTKLTNDDRGYKGKVIKLIAKLKGKDGIVYSISLGGFNRPNTWDAKKEIIKKAIKNEIDNKKGDIKELQKLYNSYDDIVKKYTNTVDDWVKSNKEFRINPPKFSLYTRLMPLDDYYRLEDSIGEHSPYRDKAPIQVESDIYIVLDDIPGINPNLKGKPVMFVSSNLLLTLSELKDLYIKQINNPNLPKLVRMVCLSNVGVSFKSLYTKKWKELYNNKVGKCTFTTPMKLEPFAIRMYKAMWNYRSGLNRFLEKYNDFLKKNNLTDELIEELCKLDNDEFDRLREEKGTLLKDGKTKILTEELYRKLVSPEIASKLKIIWDFNDSLSEYVKEFRLGYNSTHGAYIRKLTNINTKFYKEPNKAIGIYINPKIARMLAAIVDNMFTNIIDKIIKPIETNKLTYITSKLKEMKGWFKNIERHNSIKLHFLDGDVSTESDLIINDKSDLAALPMIMIKLAHYMSYLMIEGKGIFDERVAKIEGEKNKLVYSIKYQDDPLPWLGITDPITDWVSADADVEYNSNIPGVIPYNIKERTGIYDSRIDDLFNLMFHGLISTKKENTFTGNDIRATFAEFKWGIFSDPILVEKKSDENNSLDRTVTSKKFVSTNMVASLPLIAANISPYKEETKETIQPKLEMKVSNPILDLHKKIDNILVLGGINVDPNRFKSIETYISNINKKINTKLKDFILNNINIPFENIILSIDKEGNVIYLKDSKEFKDKTLKLLETVSTTTKKLTFVDNENNEYIYNINYDDGINIIPDVKEITHPDTMLIEEVKNNIINIVKDFLSSLKNEFTGETDFDTFIEDLNNNKLLQGNTISWETYNIILNNIKGDIKENYIDDEDLKVAEEALKVLEDLNELTKNNVCEV